MKLKKINLKHDEEIKLILRRHPITLFWPWAFTSLFVISAFFLLFWFMSKGIWGVIGFVALIGAALICFVRGMYFWRKDYCIITNYRIVDVNRRAIFDKVVSEVLYDQVEGVSGRVRGIFGTVFSYGDVTIQTAAGSVQIVIAKIKEPVYIQQKINEFRHENLQGLDSDN